MNVTTNAIEPLKLTLETPPQLSVARAVIRTWLADDVDEDAIADVLLATGEALANAVEHGRPPIAVGMQWSATGILAVSVNDAGSWSPPVARSNRGRGIPIMTALMDDVTIDTIDGTAVSFSRNFRR